MKKRIIALILVSFMFVAMIPAGFADTSKKTFSLTKSEAITKFNKAGEELALSIKPNSKGRNHVYIGKSDSGVYMNYNESAGKLTSVTLVYETAGAGSDVPDEELISVMLVIGSFMSKVLDSTFDEDEMMVKYYESYFTGRNETYYYTSKGIHSITYSHLKAGYYDTGMYSYGIIAK